MDLCADDEDPSQLIIRPGWDAPHVRCLPRTFCAWPCLLRQVGTVLGSPCDCIVTGITYANPGSRQLTSSPIALRLGSENRRSACFTGFVFGLMRSACSANSRGIPGMSAGHQAKISHSSWRKAMRAVACSSGRWAYTRTVFSRSVGCTWWVIVLLLMLKSRPYSFDSLRL